MIAICHVKNKEFFLSLSHHKHSGCRNYYFMYKSLILETGHFHSTSGISFLLVFCWDMNPETKNPSIFHGSAQSFIILCHPLLLLPSVFPGIRVFSSESLLCIRWPKNRSFSFSISPSNEYSGLISFRMDWLDLLAAQWTVKSLLQHHSSKASIVHSQKHQYGEVCSLYAHFVESFFLNHQCWLLSIGFNASIEMIIWFLFFNC